MKIQKNRHRIFKLLKWLLGSILFLLLSVILTLSLPPVQSYLAKKTTQYLSEKTGYTINIERLAIKWFDEIEAKEISVYDKENKLLFDIKSISIDYQIIKFWKVKEYHLDYAYLDEPNFRVGYVTDDEVITFSRFVRILRAVFIDPNKPKGNPPSPFVILKGKVNNGKFTYFDDRKTPSKLTNYFDYNFFSLDSIYGDIENFRIFKDTVSLVGIGIKAKHTDSPLRIHHLSTDFLYCSQSMLLNALDARIGNSLITDSLTFNYPHPSSFSHFNDSVKIVAKIRNSSFSSEDVKIIIPSLGIYNDTWDISTDFTGYISDFSLRNTHLHFGKNSYLKGRMTFEGLPNVSEMFMDIDFDSSYFIPQDLKQYINSESFYKNGLAKFGKTSMSGRFRGYTNNFVTHGDFSTQIGYFSTDVNFVLNKDDYSKSSYSGDLITSNFNLGKFLDNSNLGILNSKVQIKPGSYGFTTKDANIVLVGDIGRIDIKKYPYKKIHIDAALRKNIFDGNITINDPNIQLKSLAYINLNDQNQNLNIDGTIQKLHLKPLGLSKDSIEISGKLDAELKNFVFDQKNNSLNIDDLIGELKFDSVDTRFNNDYYKMVNMKFSASLLGQRREVDMKSNFIDAKLVGDFKFTHIIEDFPILVKEYSMFFENDRDKIANHYENKSKKAHDYNVELTANLKDFSSILSLIDDEIELSNNTKISAELQRGKTSVFNLKLKPEHIRFKQYDFYDNEIDINSSKLIDSSTALASIYLMSKRQKINGINYFEKSDLLINIDKENVGFIFKTNQFESNNYLYFRGNADYYRDSLLITFNNSYLHLLGNDWKINDLNKISIEPNLVRFKDVNFNNNKQVLSVEGKLSANPDDVLDVKLREFEVKNLQSFSSIALDGLISGDVKIKNAYKDIEIMSKVFIKDFAALNDTIGDIKGDIDWIDSQKDLRLNVDLIRDNKIITHAKGHFLPEKTENSFDIFLTTKDAELNILQPFLQSYTKDLKGFINGKVHLTGTPKHPSWNGKLAVTQAGFMIDYFKTYYEFENEIIFDKESIHCKNLKLIDTLWKTTAILNGRIDHHWFSNYSTTSSLKLKNTFVLNTNVKDNVLYYGQAFGTGEVNISGPFSNMKIWSKELTSNTGTFIHIPLEEPENLTKKEYIQFVTKEDKIQIKKKADPKDLNVSGIEMDINFNITKDAEFDIIFDANAGDVVKGNGNGLINLKVDTRGDFGMYGTFAFNEGSYNFTMIDLINKKFDIQRGSTITWDGDPYQGELSIDAIYQQYASLNALVPKTETSTTPSSTTNTSTTTTSTTTTETTSNADLLRKVPVDIHLGLSGKLLNPDVNFKIDIKNYPTSLEALVAETTTKFQNDDQFRNKQVFSLMVLKQFSPDQNIGDAGSATSNNLSELFSNQFSSWVSQFDENLNVAIDLSGYDSESSGIFRVKLEYSLLDGRLRVSRDGSFTNLQSSNELANVFGEWTIEYLITNDGKIRMKAFNKNTTISGPAAGVENTTNTSYGLSVTHNKSFDSFRELFKNNPNKTQVQ